MGFYDRGILTSLRDEKPRTFQQLLSEAGFSHNTLRKHLNELVDQGLVARRKRPLKGPGVSVRKIVHFSFLGFVCLLSRWFCVGTHRRFRGATLFNYKSWIRKK